MFTHRAPRLLCEGDEPRATCPVCAGEGGRWLVTALGQHWRPCPVCFECGEVPESVAARFRSERG